LIEIKIRDNIVKNTDMEQKPWYQKKKMDPAFPFTVSYCPIHNFTLHWHELIEILYISRGRMNASIEGHVFEAREGDIVVVNSGFLHGISNVLGKDAMHFNFQFGLEIFDQFLVDLQDRTVQKSVFDRQPFFSPQQDGDLYRRIKTLLLGIWEEYCGARSGFRLAVKSKLFELTLLFLREIPKREMDTKTIVKRCYNRAILERMFSYIYDNYTTSAITLEQASGAAALSKFHFARFFKEQTGLTFHMYLSKMRITRAMEYLVESDCPITDIAYQCGFASLKTFNRLFKQYTGTTPSAYRSGANSSG
jgi:AraC-like DNA-binding protein/mannose-6-phosphate isomerase-like protein (cupin superfamily)